MNTPKILTGKVMHARLFPRKNSFTYGIYYLAIPLDAIQELALKRLVTVDRFGLLSFYRKDHGDRSGSELKPWINAILADYGLKDAADSVTLIAMPRVFGYVFNPVSFWMCRDQGGHLRAVLCEVNNTFGEQHSYLCARPDKGVIQADEWLTGEKIFHVSPFLERRGTYRFRFNDTGSAFGAWIDFYDESGAKKLVTALTGRLNPYNPAQIRRCFFTYPLVTLTAIIRIHWQALRLVLKGIKYIPKPLQKSQRLSTTTNITKS